MVWTARYRELEAAGAAIFGMQLDKNGTPTTLKLQDYADLQDTSHPRG